MPVCIEFLYLSSVNVIKRYIGCIKKSALMENRLQIRYFATFGTIFIMHVWFREFCFKWEKNCQQWLIFLDRGGIHRREFSRGLRRKWICLEFNLSSQRVSALYHIWAVKVWLVMPHFESSIHLLKHCFFLPCISHLIDHSHCSCENCEQREVEENNHF